MELKIYNYTINGLNTLLIPMMNSQIISVGMFINVGSMNENKNNNGVAHFLEHLMFKSTKKRPNKTLLRSLDNLGTNYNAGTTRDHTYYEINGNKKDIEEIIDIMLDLYSNPVYENDEIELEKGVILEERKMNEDNITRALFDFIMSEIFKGTPLERKIIGTEKTIQGLTINDINNFRKLYTLKNSLFVIAGNFSKKTTINIIKKHLKEYKFLTDKIDEPVVNYKILSNKPNIYIIPNNNLSQSYIYLSFYFDNLTFEQESIIKFLSTYLSSGSTSKLFEVLRNKLGSSYSNESSYIIFKGTYGMFYIYCNVNNKLILESITEILNIIKNLKTTYIPKEEINKVKKIFETNNLFEINNPNNIMMFHAYNYLYNRKNNIFDSVNFINKLTPEIIKDFSIDFFLKKNMNVFIYGNDIEQSQIAKIINIF
jgi:predicted Zn-dependent peptidase